MGLQAGETSGGCSAWAWFGSREATNLLLALILLALILGGA